MLINHLQLYRVVQCSRDNIMDYNNLLICWYVLSIYHASNPDIKFRKLWKFVRFFLVHVVPLVPLVPLVDFRFLVDLFFFGLRVALVALVLLVLLVRSLCRFRAIFCCSLALYGHVRLLCPGRLHILHWEIITNPLYVGHVRYV